jgi:adenine-specific DNA-methyltransferase
MHKIIHGDCIQELKKLPSESVDLILTDPPYGNDESYCRDKRTIASDEHPLTGLLALAEAYRVLSAQPVLLHIPRREALGVHR